MGSFAAIQQGLQQQDCIVCIFTWEGYKLKGLDFYKQSFFIPSLKLLSYIELEQVYGA